MVNCMYCELNKINDNINSLKFIKEIEFMSKIVFLSKRIADPNTFTGRFYKTF